MEVDIGQDVGSICSAIASNYHDTNAVIICGSEQGCATHKAHGKACTQGPSENRAQVSA